MLGNDFPECDPACAWLLLFSLILGEIRSSSRSRQAGHIPFGIPMSQGTLLGLVIVFEDQLPAARLLLVADAEEGGALGVGHGCSPSVWESLSKYSPRGWSCQIGLAETLKYPVHVCEDASQDMPKERIRTPEQTISPELAQAFAGTFIPRYDLYPVQRPDGSYVTLRRKLSLDLIISHLQGFITLGAYALDVESQARWVCLDADTPDQWQRVWRMAEALDRQGIVPYLETSRRGGHLWLFLDSLPGADARRFGQRLQAEYSLTDVELYPKQDELKTGPGSLVRLPLGVHLKSGQRYSFVKLDGQPLAPTIREQIQLLTHPERVPAVFVSEVLSRLSQEAFSPPERQSSEAVDPNQPLSDRLKQTISVYDYVAQYVDLDERGRGHCPFHADHHKSLGVNRESNYWHCFAGCGGGSLIDFAMLWREKQGEDDSFTATIKALAGTLLPRSEPPRTGR